MSYEQIDDPTEAKWPYVIAVTYSGTYYYGCDTENDVWSVPRAVGSLYAVSSPQGLDVSQFIPF